MLVQTRSRMAIESRAIARPNPQVPPNPIADYFQNWFVRSEKAKPRVAHRITAPVTVTARLEREIRFD
jgi:hypothetical protein